MESWRLLEIETPGGSVSPHVLFSNATARAILITLAAGQELGDHQVKERAWICVVDGAAEIECAEGAIEAGPGTLAMFAPDERHTVRSREGARLLLFLAPWPGEGHYRGHERAGAAGGG